MSDGDPATVLIADDEPAIVDGQASRLETKYRVRRAYGGREALDELDDTVDVALLDRRMPDRSGDEILDRIRELGYSCRVAMLTGVEPSFDIAEMGFDDYIRKPVDEAELFEVVENLLARRTYDAGLREFYSVARRIALLETEYDREELVESEAYQRLSDRRAELRDHLDEALDDLPEMEG
ncbi:MAG: response regulator transcription factor, partial [Haloglomus sp.]